MTWRQQLSPSLWTVALFTASIAFGALPHQFRAARVSGGHPLQACRMLGTLNNGLDCEIRFCR